MHRPSPSHYPNLPHRQRFTQWLVDAFNADESAWRRLRERIGSGMKAKRGKHTTKKRSARTAQKGEG